MSSVPVRPIARPHIDRETPKPRMAKASIVDLTLREKRAKHGAILRKASELAGMNREQTANHFQVDPAQVSRWWSGDENPQTWRYEQDPLLKIAYMKAQAATDDSKITVRTVIEIEE